MFAIKRCKKIMGVVEYLKVWYNGKSYEKSKEIIWGCR